MLDDLFASAQLLEREEDGYFWLTKAEEDGGTITLSLDILSVQYPDIHPHWQVTCSGVREHSLSLGYADKFQLTDDHVLLWAHTKRKLSTYFSGACTDADAVIGALYQCHHELTDGWLPFHRFLNPNVDIMKLLTGGSGMFAEGAEPLLLAYEDVLRKFGFTVSHVDAGEPAFWNGETWLEQREKLSVLVIDKSYIVAETFIAKMA
jgi:hypothetical protein